MLMKIWPILLGMALPAAAAVEQPGIEFHLKPNELPAPYATPGVANASKTIPQPKGAAPLVPKGFKISVFASGLEQPRWMAEAPNGDIFLTEPDADKVTLLHGGTHSTFAGHFNHPHGLVFDHGALYVADLTAVWKIAYKDGARHGGPRERLTKDAFGKGGHNNRDVIIGPDGQIYVAIGSSSNMAEDAAPRATVQLVGADGHLSTFASGMRNPVGMAFYPGTNRLFVTVNERDGYGDGLVPDYLTEIEKGDFYGWPYAYTGTHPDPDYGKKRPDLVARSKTPDLLFQSHSAPLGLVFYDGSQFPADYKGDAFVALHGSWDSAKPTGYKVVRVKFAHGKPVGGYQNFVTGFWDGSTSPAKVWGRPAGVLVTKDGSLLISDDVGKKVWRVRYGGT